MNKTINSVLGLCLVLVASVSIDAKAWRGITPLHSTRKDVERILGISRDPCKCVYKTDSEVITIDYARQTCHQNPDGWNIPSDTVMTITVSSTTPPLFSDLKIDERKYKQTRDMHTTAIYYFNEEEGITYQVSDDGTVGTIVYGPSTSDSKLRCREFAEANEDRFEPVFDQYGDIAFNDEKPRLDNFAAQLTHFTDSVGYILIYSDRRTSVKALNRSRRARNYLVSVRRIQANRVIVIQGACRDRLVTQLYILPSSSPSPRPESQRCK